MPRHVFLSFFHSIIFIYMHLQFAAWASHRGAQFIISVGEDFFSVPHPGTRALYGDEQPSHVRSVGRRASPSVRTQRVHVDALNCTCGSVERDAKGMLYGQVKEKIKKCRSTVAISWNQSNILDFGFKRRQLFALNICSRVILRRGVDYCFVCCVYTLSPLFTTFGVKLQS
jgi:hypothetical protein